MHFNVRYIIVLSRHISFKNYYQIRSYQSDKVFGYRKKPQSKFKVLPEIRQARCEAINFYSLLLAYRKYGHKYGKINPVTFCKTEPVEESSELNFKNYGFNDCKQQIYIPKEILNLPGNLGNVSLEAVIEYLNNVYCNHLTFEFDHLETEEEREWFAFQIENEYKRQLDTAKKLSILTDLLESEAFDNFLAKKFASVKRYGAEGAESMMAFFNEVFQLSSRENLEQIVLAMPHRGRLNLLTGLLNYPPAQMFSKLQGNADFPDKYECSGDVLSHLISSTNLTYGGSNSIHVSLIYNPSHLEAANPVSMGKTRSKQLSANDGDYGHIGRQWSDKILNIQVHGDAAIIGQGINQECLALSGVPHYEIGGTIHLVVNNQVGFTTPSDRGRSSRYCTDLAKSIAAPILHVNGDHPEEVIKATTLAYNYQRKFRKDVFIDMNCYRRWGHNEMDDPTFTNPALYNQIQSRKSVPTLYKEKLINQNITNEKECSEIYDKHFDWLSKELEMAKDWIPKDLQFKEQWKQMSQAAETLSIWDTGIEANLLKYIAEKSVEVPASFKVHPTIQRGHINNRLSKLSNEKDFIDWSTAEAMAIGSLLLQGHNVRMSGQDVGRGTFSQRHAMLVNQHDNHIFIPLNNIDEAQTAYLELANSILSEEAVLGYEYGMSIDNPNNLIIWEAQFGDFFNGAQIIFDTFISSGEAKWLWQSGLTVLLPHGFDGAGPEHSSARIERFLQLTNSKEDQIDSENVNMQVCQPSTPAQYFHLLRRQMLRNFRKPLIMFTPKTLLRAPECVSRLSDMSEGMHFQPIIGDNNANPSKVTRILLTSGKHYYNLHKEMQSIKNDNTAIIRIESFCPFPSLELITELEKYANSKIFVWCQEEPQNMGAWSFIKRRFESLIGKPIRYCGRPVAAAPAVGVAKIHQQQQLDITTKPFTM